MLANQSLLDLSQRIEALQAEARTLRGADRELQHQVQQTQNQQRDLYGDVDRRLAALEGGGGAGACRQQAAAGTRACRSRRATTVRTTRPRSICSRRQVRRGDRRLPAVPRRRSRPARWRTTRSTGSARLTTSTSNTRRAARLPHGLEKYPESRKTPDALLKIGYCNYELKRLAEARSSLSQVVQRFPDTTAARLASQRLAKMDAAKEGERVGAAPSSAATPAEQAAAARLKITEIFLSIQGEADSVGWPTVFVRLTGCPLRCQYCDTRTRSMAASG